MSPPLVLAADAGGTNSRMAFFEVDAVSRMPLLPASWSRTYPSADFTGLEHVVARALADSGLSPSAVAAGVAGPVIAGRCRTTNLPWEVDSAALARAAGLSAASLLNDLEANAWGLDVTPPEAVLTLHAGSPDAAGTQALIAAGTGLGQAIVASDGTHRVIAASEGGHASFAPGCDDDDALLRWLRARHDHGHVSWERVVSGPGLAAIATFLAETGRETMPADLAEELEQDGASAVTEAADAGLPIAVRALRTFVRLYGAEAGNLALKVLATGGVFVGGGIAPRIRRWMEGPEFLAGFLDKGRMRPLLERMPVRMLLDDRVALYGAARHAACRAAGMPPPA